MYYQMLVEFQTRKSSATQTMILILLPIILPVDPAGEGVGVLEDPPGEGMARASGV